MAKRIKFPLVMKNAVEARDMEALRENFDMESIVEYFINGKLAKWLTNNYEDEILKDIQELKGDEADFGERLAKALGVKWSNEDKVDLQNLMKTTELKERVKPYISGEELEKVEYIADTQEELERLVKKGCIPVYLFGKEFQIKEWMENVECIGIDNPVISVEIRSRKEFQEKKIKLKNVGFADKEMKKIVSGNEETELYLGLLDVMEQYLTAVQKSLD